jgi:hypothetical protein
MLRQVAFVEFSGSQLMLCGREPSWVQTGATWSIGWDLHLVETNVAFALLVVGFTGWN